jgi:hypothetical protein
MTARTLKSITVTIIWLGILGFPFKHVRSQDITFSSVSVILKEDGTGKVIVDTRPQDQLETLKPLSQPMTDSAFFGSAEVEKVGENRHHVRYDFSKFRELSEWRSQQMTPEMFSTIKIDADENALILTPIKPANLGFKLSQLAFPLAFGDDFAIRVNLLGANQGDMELQFFDRKFISIKLYGSDSPAEPPGTVTISQLGGNKVLAKTIASVEKKNEVSFKLKNEFRKTSFKIVYKGDTTIGISSLDVIADFQPTYGIALQMQGTRITVKQVFPGTSGDLAGVKAGDQLKTINGTSPKDIETALQLMSDADIEKELPIEIVRLGRTRTLMLKPGGIPTPSDSDEK